MSSQSPNVGARHPRRRPFMPVALVCFAVVAGLGAWSWLGSGSSHHVTAAQHPASFAAPNCAHAIATEPAGAQWTPVTSSAPSDVAAVMESEGLAMLESRLGLLTMDMPMLVYPLNMRTGYDANDCPHWVASFHDDAGKYSGTVDYVLDPARHWIRFFGAGTIFPGDKRFGKVFPYLTLDQALALLRQQRGQAGSTVDPPMLVFFMLKQGWAGDGQPDTTSAHIWTDSGTVAAEPMWRLVGSDSKVYFVGGKRHVYAISEVPMA